MNTETDRKEVLTWVIVDLVSGDIKGEYESQLEASYTLAVDMRSDYGLEAEGWGVRLKSNVLGKFFG